MRKDKRYSCFLIGSRLIILMVISIFVSCKPINNVQFTNQYVNNNKDKISVEIPEVHELIHIMIAITDKGQKDTYLINKKTDYYDEVMGKFSEYKNHEAIKMMNIEMPLSEGRKASSRYYSFKMNACGYIFNTDNRITDDNIIKNMGFSRVNYVRKYIKEIQKFSDQTGFREFYLNHIEYYDSLISLYNKLNPIRNMQSWLEIKFPYRYDNYRIIFSPLVGGSHSTQRFENNGFKQTVMFINGPSYDKRYNLNVNTMLQSRIVFTEIDHNYVNPTSKILMNEIYKSFSEERYWANENALKYYASPLRVFNEYMTWAIYSIYCLDNYSLEDVDIFVKLMEDQMKEGRGFVKFREFNQQLIKLYNENNKIEMNDLYKKMLDWSIMQQHTTKKYNQ